MQSVLVLWTGIISSRLGAALLLDNNIKVRKRDLHGSKTLHRIQDKAQNIQADFLPQVVLFKRELEIESSTSKDSKPM